MFERNLSSFKTLLLALVFGVVSHPGLAQENVLLQQLGSEAVLLSKRPIDNRIDLLVMQQEKMARANDVIGTLAQAGLQVGRTGVLNVQDIQGQLSQPGVVIILGAQALSHELLAFVHDEATRPVIYRTDEKNLATPVTLTRGDVRFGNGEMELSVTGTATNLLFFNGDPYEGIDELLVAPGQQRQQLIQLLQGVGLSVASTVNFNQQTARKIAKSGVGFLTTNSNFRTAENDQLLNLATDLQIYALERGRELVELRVFRTQAELVAANSKMDETETLPSPSDIANTREPTSEETATPSQQDLVETVPEVVEASPSTGEAKPSAALEQPGDVAASRAMPRDVEELLLKARAQSSQCEAFFTWMSRYYIEYDLDPYGPNDFYEQREQLGKRPSPNTPIAKLYTDEAAAILYGVAPEQVNYLMTEQFRRFIPACFRSVYGDRIFNDLKPVAQSHSKLLGLMEQRFRQNPRGKKLMRAVSGVERAYQWFSETISHLTDPPVALTSDRLDRLEEHATSQARILWPSDAARSLTEINRLIAMRRDEAQQNDQLAAEAQRQRDIVLAERAEKQRIVSISNCIAKMTHPDDPDRSPDIEGFSDEAVSDFVRTPIDDCALALAEYPDDPQVTFYMGRAQLFADRQEQAIDYLIDAAEDGNAVAYSYLAEFDPDPTSAIKLLSISADLGFLPAFEMLDELEAHIADLETFERERLAEEARVEAETQRILEEQRATALACDRAARHPLDRSSYSIPAVEDDNLNIENVIEVCSAAIEADPMNGRLRFQLVRALSLLEGFEAEVDEQLKRASDLDYGLATYVLFQLEENPDKALELLEKAAREGVQEAVSNLSKIPRLPPNTRMEMFYQDPSRLYSIANANPTARDVTIHSTAHCMRQYRMWSGNMRVGFIQHLQTIVYPGTTMLDGILATAEMSREAQDRRAEAWCGLVTKEYGTCVDVYLSDVNADIFEKLDDVTYNTIVLANSENARGDAGWFDRMAGPLTDYAGYFYARKLDIVTPFEDVAFDEHFMFTESSDPFVVEVAREIIKEDKLFVVTQAISNEHLCQ